jgi:glutathione synthase
MSITLGVVMDPIESIAPYKDTTLAMMLAASARGWTIHTIDQKDIYLDQGRAFSRRRKVSVYDDSNYWFDAESAVDAPLSEHDHTHAQGSSVRYGLYLHHLHA